MINMMDRPPANQWIKMKNLISLGLGVLAFISFTPFLSYGANEDKVIKVVADNWCPYNCKPLDEKRGYIIDVLQKIYEPKGYVIKYDLVPWTRSIRGTRNGQYDVIVGAYKTDVPDFIFPKKTIGLSQNVMARRIGSDWTYQGISSLRDQYIAFVDGYSFGETLDRYFESTTHNIMRLHGADALGRALSMINGATLHGVLDDENVLKYKIKKLDLNGEIILTNAIGGNKDVYVAFSPQKHGNRILVKIFDEGLERLRQTGALDEILIRYELKDWQTGHLE